MLTKLDIINKKLLEEPWRSGYKISEAIGPRLFATIWDAFIACFYKYNNPKLPIIQIELKDKINQLCILGFKLAIRRNNNDKSL